MLRLLHERKYIVEKNIKQPHPKISETILGRAEEAQDRLYRFQYVTTALSQAVTPTQIAEIIVSLGVATLRAIAGSVWLFDENQNLSLTASTGYSKKYLEEISSLRKKGATPTMDAVRYKKPILLRSLEERKKLYPHTTNAFTTMEQEGFIAIPLIIGNTTLGVVNFVFGKAQQFAVEEQEFMYALMQQCSQALDRARLYQEEVRQKAELQDAVDRINVLQKATTTLSQTLTSSQMGQIIIQAGMDALGAVGGEVSVVSKDTSQMMLIAHKGHPENYVKIFKTNWVIRDEHEPMLMKEVLKKKEPLVITDCSKISHKYDIAKKVFAFTGFKAVAIIPIKDQKGISGIFSLFFKDTKVLPKEDINFLTALTQQFSEAYERAKIYEEEKNEKTQLEYLIERITTLQEVTKMLSSELTLEGVLKTILEQGISALGAMGGEITVLSDDEKFFRTIAYKGYPKEFKENFTKKWQKVSTDQPTVAGDAIRAKRPIFLTDLSDLPSTYKMGKEFAKMTKSRSSVSVPLMVNGKPFGIFYLLFKNITHFSSEDKKFIATLAQHASLALERARTYEKEKAITESLRQSEENWRQLAESLPQLVWAGDKSGRAYYWSKRWEEYTGIPQNELRSEDYWNKLIHPEDKVVGQDLWKVALQDKKSLQFESRLKAKNGEYHWFLSKAVPIKDKKGNIMRWFGTETDIHEQKMLTDQLQKQEARFRSIIENSSDAIALIDKKGTILYASPSTQHVTGYAPEERVGTSVFASIHPKDKNKIREFVDTLIASSEDTLHTIHYRRINKNGYIPWMEAVGRNLLHNPNVGALVITYRDITERVESEQAIRQSRDELEIILENVADAIVVWDGKGKILYANQAAANLNRYPSPEALIEDSSYSNYLTRFEKITDENDRLFSEEQLTVPRTLTEKKAIALLMRVTFRENHQDQWRFVKSAPILDAQGNINLIVSVSQDVTEEKEKEKVKDEFISTASHELKTPITSAKLYAGILSERIQQAGDEKTYSIIMKLDTQLDRLTKLINDLLDATKIKSGHITFTKEKTGVEDFIRDVVDEMQYTTVTHSLSLSGESKKYITLDRDRIRQVFVNLISNAIKYSPERKKVEISLEDKENGVVVAIKDYGVGIEKSEQEKVFEPFYRSEFLQGGRFSGLGLGLHISSEIVKRHGGRVWMDSSLGHGTTMFVFIPDKYKGK